jgi:hypothetical protein
MSTENQPELTIEQRVASSLAVGRYLRAKERAEQAYKEHNEACTGIRSTIARGSRFVTKVDYRYFVVTVDSEGDFEVDEVDFL